MRNDEDMDYRNVTLLQALDHYARTTPDRPFLRWRDDQPRTFGQTHHTARAVAAGLSDLGVGEGDTVLVMLPNGLELVHAWFGCNVLGALQVPLNTFLRGDFLTHAVNDSTARVMVIDAGLVPLLEQLPALDHLTTLVVVGETPPTAPHGLTVVPYAEVAAHEPVEHLAQREFGDLSAIYYTSGTTGPAKGIMFTYGQAAVTARNYLDATGAHGDDVFFCCMPLFHSNAQVLQVVAPLMVGAQVSIWPQFSASHWLDQVRSVGATITNTLGVMAEFLHRQPPRPDDADNPLRVVQTIPAPSSIVDEIERRFGFTCVDGYGLTDVGMVAFRRHDEPMRPGSSGRAVDDFEVLVADPETDEPLPPGQVGEILVRPRVPGGFMRGYWQRPDLTIAAWRNLWFHTGDSGYFDHDGHLFFSDRMGDSIRVRGENIASSQIEAVVADHPAVQVCAAVAVPSDVGDYDVLLCVVPREGASVSPPELLEFCEGRMPYFAVPRYVRIMEELPMTPTQKIQKAELRKAGVPPTVWDRVAEGFEVRR